MLLSYLGAARSTCLGDYKLRRRLRGRKGDRFEPTVPRRRVLGPTRAVSCMLAQASRRWEPRTVSRPSQIPSYLRSGAHFSWNDVRVQHCAKRHRTLTPIVYLSFLPGRRDGQLQRAPPDSNCKYTPSIRARYRPSGPIAGNHFLPST